MKFNPESYLAASLDSIESNEILLSTGHVHGTMNRAYYGIFYCAQLIVLSEGSLVKTHTGLKTRFNQLFVKTGKIDFELAEKYNNPFHRRQAADYNLDAAFTKEDAEQALQFAKDFYQFTKTYFNL